MLGTRTVLTIEFVTYEQATRGGRASIHAILATLKELLAPALAAPGSVAIPAMGGVRRVAVDGATLALTLADQLVQHAEAAGAPVRCALTTGDLELDGSRMFGEALSLGEVLLEQVPPGEAWFDDATRSAMLPATVAWEEVGEWRLRGVASVVRASRLVPAGRCWLPERVEVAARQGRLVLTRPETAPATVPPEAVVVVLGGESAPAVEALAATVRPDHLFLQVFRVATDVREAWVAQGRGLVVSTEATLHAAVAAFPARHATGDEIVLEVGGDGGYRVQMAGLALPRCPVAGVLTGYRFALLPDGRWVTRDAERALVVVSVTESGATLRVLATGVSIDGRTQSPGAEVPLDVPHALETEDGVVSFHPVAEGPWLGAFRSGGGGELVFHEGSVSLGREPAHPGLALPDRRGQDGSTWVAGALGDDARAAGTTVDRATTGRVMGHLTAEGGQLTLHVTHRTPIGLSESPGGPVTLVEGGYVHVVNPGDWLWLGTTLATVG
jgi:hypothetical protein